MQIILAPQILGLKEQKRIIIHFLVKKINKYDTLNYEGWNFNFGNTPLDWIQELLD